MSSSNPVCSIAGNPFATNGFSSGVVTGTLLKSLSAPNNVLSVAQWCLLSSHQSGHYQRLEISPCPAEGAANVACFTWRWLSTGETMQSSDDVRILVVADRNCGHGLRDVGRTSYVALFASPFASRNLGTQQSS